MYSDKVMDHFSNPRNMGELEDYDAVGKVGNPVCGDVMHIYIKVAEGRISDIKFKTMGCAAAIATSSMVTELAKGKKIDEALAMSRDDVAKALEGLPPAKMHCSNLAADGLHKAIENFLAGKRDGDSEDEIKTQLAQKLGIGPGGANALWDAGICDVDEVLRLTTEELSRIGALTDGQKAKILPRLHED